MKSILLLSAAFGTSLASTGASDFLFKRQTSSAPTVNTTSGLVAGHTASNTTNVSEYLGIPYAKPPIGDLRFAPPQAYTGSSSINGTNFGFACATTTAVSAAGGTGSFNIAGANLTAAGITLLSTFGQLSDKFGEDCLTLNVWVPSGGEQKKAVLLWIYGGGFTTGSTSTPEYNGKHLAEQEDVIVVSVNYRLNIFGFPGNPAEPHLNLGLLDQRLGIEWTRDNIASFGGDASRVTIFGQSAGSASVDYYSYAYTSDPIVAGFIQESGTVNGFGQSSTAAANAGWFNVTAKLNCGDASSNTSAVLTCMRTKNTSEILLALPSSVSSSTSASSFGPAVDNLTVFGDYPARSSAGNFAKLPLLIGSTDYEAGIFAAIDALYNVTFPQSYWLASDLSTFTCPAGVRANISIENNVPTWRYRWFGAFPNTRLTTVPDSGAWHSSEILSIFDTAPTGGSIPNATTEEVAIGKYIRGAWAAFAKNPKAGLSSYGGGWPLYDPGKDTLVRLAYQNMTGLNLSSPAVYDVGCNGTVTVNSTSGTATSSAGTSGTASASASASASAKSSAATVEGNSFGGLLVLVFMAALGVACLS